MRGVWLVLVLVMLANSAASHSPYFGRDALCRGEGWTMRLLFGDGIIGTNPAAAVVLDDAGHVLAFQNLGASPFRLLGKDCRIWSWNASEGYTPSPRDFARGPRLAGDDDDARAARWKFEPGFHKEEGFGFAPVTNKVSGVLVLASEMAVWWRGVIFFIILGLVPVGLVYAMVATTGGGWARPLGFGIGVALALGVWGVLLLFLAAFGDISPALAGTIALLEAVFLIIAGALSAFGKTQLPD